MSHSLGRVFVHVVFSTKNRMHFFQNQDFRRRMHAYLAGILKSRECIPIEVGGHVDHVHVLTCLANSISVAELTKELKRVSTIWVNGQTCNCDRFSWQEGYSAFSVSQGLLARAVDYIREQEEHHRRMTYEEEIRALLSPRRTTCGRPTGG